MTVALFHQSEGYRGKLEYSFIPSPIQNCNETRRFAERKTPFLSLVLAAK